jgi:hypothetical protein
VVYLWFNDADTPEKGDHTGKLGKSRGKSPSVAGIYLTGMMVNHP